MLGELVGWAAPLWPAWLVFAVPFLYFLNEPFTVALHQAVAVPLLFLLAGGRAYRPGNQLSGWFFRLCLGWLLVMGLSAVRSVDPSVSAPVFLKLLGLVAIAATVRYAGPDTKVGPALFAAAALAGVVHGWLARGEYLEAAPIPPSWVDPEMRGLIPTRCAGLFSDPNVFGAYLAALLPFTLGGIFTDPDHPVRPYLFGAGFFGAGVALLTTFSRTGYLAGLLAVAVFLALHRPERRLSMGMKVFVVACLLLLGVFVLGPFRHRLLSIANPSDMTTSQRTLINRGIMRAVDRIPFFGYGLHTFNTVYPQFRIVGGDYPFNAHNEFLHTLVEAGPLATGLLGALCLLLVLQVWREWRRPAPGPTGLRAAGAAAWAALFLQNLGGFSDRIFPTAVVLAVATGLVLRMATRGRPGRGPESPFGTPMARGLAGFGLVVFLLLTFKYLHVQLVLERAGVALRAGNPAEARQSLEALDRFDPRLPVVQAMLAGLDEQMGDLEGARNRLELATRLNPAEALFWAELSRLADRTRQGDPIALLLKAIALDPASERFRLQAARLLAAAGRTLEAVAQLDEALRTSPGFDDVYTTYREVKAYRAFLLGQPAATGAASGPPAGVATGSGRPDTAEAPPSPQPASTTAPGSAPSPGNGAGTDRNPPLRPSHEEAATEGTGSLPAGEDSRMGIPDEGILSPGKPAGTAGPPARTGSPTVPSGRTPNAEKGVRPLGSVPTRGTGKKGPASPRGGGPAAGQPEIPVGGPAHPQVRPAATSPARPTGLPAPARKATATGSAAAGRP
ncbi:MAG: hypothetical protein GX442_17650 [Candidatus Riflebacteria bacterium]|nr:hypothetical protein [Candidatus Riflebacteria bacterium]